MLIDRNVVQAALEALESCVGSRYGRDWNWPESAFPSAMAHATEARDALRAALAAPQPEPVADDEVATFINTMAGQFAAVIAEIWHAHPDYGIRQTLDELNRRFPAPQPEPVAWEVANIKEYNDV